MKRNLFWLVGLWSCFLLTSAKANNATLDESVDATSVDKDKRMEWFSKAKLGIFVHWGIYAVGGVSESWSFYNNYIPYEAYMQQAKGFTASRYNPEEWARLFKESGAQYAVITTKHHDGMALWPTKVSQHNVVAETPAGKDLIAPFAKAVRKEGMKLGLYYSLLDWSHHDYPNKTRTVKRYVDDEKRWGNFVRFNFEQLRELNLAYQPSLYWFDGDWEQSAERWHAADLVKMLRSTNPQVILNSRIKGSGDYATPEQGVPVVKPKDKYWELCMTINSSWGYQHHDHNYKTPHMILRTFVDCLSMGGNLLLDVGPKEDGTIPQEQQEVLRELGRWIKKHKEAVYDTQAGIPAEHFQGYSTLNGQRNILYLYLPYRPNGAIEVKGLKNKVHRVWVVGNGTMLPHKIHNKAYWSSTPGNLYIDVPERVQDPQITVLALLLDGPIQLYNGSGKEIDSN